MDERDRRHLRDLVDQARAALGYARAHGQDWWQNAETVDAVLMRVSQVGEAARRTSPEVLVAIPGVTWRDVKGMRSMIIHEYRALDLDVLRDVVDHRLPTVMSIVEQALATIGPD